MSTLSVAVRLSTPGFELDVAFEAPVGVTVLFGPSGSGKSRTLGSIAGIVKPDQGRIALGDAVFFDERTSMPIHERRAAYVFQSLALFPHMTAAANVAYGLPRGPGSREESLALLERMRVGHLADRKPHTFSGGEAQRVALARAFAMKPRVVLLDEPFSALDRSVKDSLLAETRELIAREKVPAIVVTHDAEEARQLGERVIFLEHGKVAGTSTIAEARFSRP